MTDDLLLHRTTMNFAFSSGDESSVEQHRQQRPLGEMMNFAVSSGDERRPLKKRAVAAKHANQNQQETISIASSDSSFDDDDDEIATLSGSQLTMNNHHPDSSQPVSQLSAGSPMMQTQPSLSASRAHRKRLLDGTLIDSLALVSAPPPPTTTTTATSTKTNDKAKKSAKATTSTFALTRAPPKKQNDPEATKKPATASKKSKSALESDCDSSFTKMLDPSSTTKPSKPAKVSVEPASDKIPLSTALVRSEANRPKTPSKAHTSTNKEDCSLVKAVASKTATAKDSENTASSIQRAPKDSSSKANGTVSDSNSSSCPKVKGKKAKSPTPAASKRSSPRLKGTSAICAVDTTDATSVNRPLNTTVNKPAPGEQAPAHESKPTAVEPTNAPPKKRKVPKTSAKASKIKEDSNATKKEATTIASKTNTNPNDKAKPQSRLSTAEVAPERSTKDAAKASKSKPASKTTTSKATSEATTTSKAPPPPAAKKKKGKKMTFQDQVLNHMLWTFKPFTIRTLSEELKTSDTQLNYVLLSLLDKGLVLKKEFTSGKAGRVKELYWADHSAKKSKDVNVQVQATAQEREQAKMDLAELQAQDTSLRHTLKQVLQQPSNDALTLQLAEADTFLQDAKQKAIDIKARIAKVRASSLPSSSLTAHRMGRMAPPKSAALLARERCPRRLKLRINAMRIEWKKRKEKCIDFVDQLADGMEKKPKEVVKVLDLDTDEMNNAVLPPKHDLEN